MIGPVHVSEINQLEYVIDARGIVIVKYLGDESDVAVPAAIDDVPVYKIADYAYSGKNMKYIRLPESLRVIDHHGFSDCHALHQIIFPSGLEIIGNYAFYNCWEVALVHLPGGLRSIGYGAFKNCEKLSEIIQDKIEGKNISIGSILDDLNQQIHVEIRHIFPDGEVKSAKLIFTEMDYEAGAFTAAWNRQFDAGTIGSGKYIRYCVGSNDIDYMKYDGMFHVLLRGDSFDTIITVAVERLMFPYMLHGEGRGKYTDYIMTHGMQACEKYIKEDQPNQLSFILGLGVLDADETDQMIELAMKLDRTAFTALLMDYKHQHFSMADDLFEL